MRKRSNTKVPKVIPQGKNKSSTRQSRGVFVCLFCCFVLLCFWPNEFGESWVQQRPNFFFFLLPTAGLLRAFDRAAGVTNIPKEGEDEGMSNSFLEEHFLEVVVLGQDFGTHGTEDDCYFSRKDWASSGASEFSQWRW